MVCGVAYGEDIDGALEVIRSAVDSCETVDGNYEPVQVFACEFGSSSIDFEVAWWTGSRPVDIRRSRDEVIAAIKRRLDEAGIEIPFPYRTLTFAEPVPLDNARAAPSRNRQDGIWLRVISCASARISNRYTNYAPSHWRARKKGCKA